MKHPAFAVLQDKGHRVVLAIDLGFRFRQNFDGGSAGQARIELIDGLERREPARDGMLHGGHCDLEGAVRVVPAELRVPYPPDELLELGPALERPAGEVNGHQTAALIREFHQVLSRLRAGIGRFPVHEVQHRRVVVAEFFGGEERRRRDDIDPQPRVLAQQPGQYRRRLLPFVPRVVDPRDNHHAARLGLHSREARAGGRQDSADGQTQPQKTCTSLPHTHPCENVAFV